MPGLTTDDLVIRAADSGDVAAVLKLWSVARTAHAATSDRAGDVKRLIGDREESLLVAEASGVIIGALIATWDGWRGNLYRLAVDASHRRRGVALRLVRAGEDRLRRRGVRRVTALVAYEDAVAVAFWTAVGYPQDREIGRHVRNL